MLPLSLFQWFEATPVGQVVRQSLWLFPVIEAVHLLGLCLLGGAILIVDLRMFGWGLSNQRIADVAGRARPWLLGALAVMILTGTTLFLSEAVKCYYNTSFWVKMATLPVALGFTFAVRDPVARRQDMKATKTTRFVSLLSVVLWFVVAAAGRWIGFS